MLMRRNLVLGAASCGATAPLRVACSSGTDHAFGNPSLPRWLGSRLMGLFFTPKSENERYAKQIRNSAGIAVFASSASEKAHWIEAGHGAGHPQCVPESAGGGWCHPAAVRVGVGAGQSAAGPGGAFRTRAIDADVDAAAGAGSAGLS